MIAMAMIVLGLGGTLCRGIPVLVAANARKIPWLLASRASRCPLLSVPAILGLFLAGIFFRLAIIWFARDATVDIDSERVENLAVQSSLFVLPGHIFSAVVYSCC
jgi:hypothetical protein